MEHTVDKLLVMQRHYDLNFCDGIWKVTVENVRETGCRLVVTNQAVLSGTWPDAPSIIDMQEVVMLQTYDPKVPGSVVEVYDYGCHRGDWSMDFIVGW